MLAFAAILSTLDDPFYDPPEHLVKYETPQQRRSYTAWASKLRDDLNTLAIVFDENTRLTMDRLSRAVLYDLTELENASRIKKGETTRTEKKIAGVNRWFGKLDKDFDAFLVYFS